MVVVWAIFSFWASSAWCFSIVVAPVVVFTDIKLLYGAISAIFRTPVLEALVFVLKTFSGLLFYWWFDVLCTWSINLQQNEIGAFEGESSGSKSPDANVAIMSLVEIPIFWACPSDDELALRWPPIGFELLCIFITCFLRVSMLKLSLLYFGCWQSLLPSAAVFLIGLVEIKLFVWGF